MAEQRAPTQEHWRRGGTCSWYRLSHWLHIFSELETITEEKSRVDPWTVTELYYWLVCAETKLHAKNGGRRMLISRFHPLLHRITVKTQLSSIINNEWKNVSFCCRHLLWLTSIKCPLSWPSAPQQHEQWSVVLLKQSMGGGERLFRCVDIKSQSFLFPILLEGQSRAGWARICWYIVKRPKSHLNAPIFEVLAATDQKYSIVNSWLSFDNKFASSLWMAKMCIISLLAVAFACFSEVAITKPSRLQDDNVA